MKVIKRKRKEKESTDIVERENTLPDDKAGFTALPVREDAGRITDEQIRHALMNPDTGNHLG